MPQGKEVAGSMAGEGEREGVRASTSVCGPPEALQRPMEQGVGHPAKRTDFLELCCWYHVTRPLPAPTTRPLQTSTTPSTINISAIITTTAKTTPTIFQEEAKGYHKLK